MIEQWRPVVGWEGLYEVSDQGRVRSNDRIIIDKWGGRRLCRGRLLKHVIPKSARCDYPRVTLTARPFKKTTIARVHLLVMRAFVGPPPPEQQIRHLNGDHNDPRLANLAYGTISENTYDSIRHGTHHSATRTHCPSGHELSGDNVRITHGRRFCRACCLRNSQNYRTRQKQQKAS